ncbi:hypothetical protein NFI96_014434 [Prochilodus magdalenae]|nr:hypothetical protein NFI96_014434 [Prochilodus magdalenae]
MSADRWSWTLTGATVAGVAALYLPIVQRTVPGGDSGRLQLSRVFVYTSSQSERELITAACELGVAHPPGYPLFTMLAFLAIHLLPGSSPAHSINVLCALLGAGASGTLCYTVCRLARPGPGAVLAGGLFAMSRLVWQWSTVAEVFSLNNFFVGLLFSLLACFDKAENVAWKTKFALWGALCCGLGLCNQHTLVVYVLVIVPWVLLQLYTHNAKSEGKVNLVEMLQRHCAVVLLFAAMVSLYSVFFAWRANLDIEKPLLLGVVERFWLQADAGICVLAGVGLSWAVCWLEKRLGWYAVWTTGAWLLTAGLLSQMIHANYRECDQSSNEVVEKFAREVVFSFPNDSVVLTRGDLPGNTLRYLHYCQGLRPDLSLVDQEMMTYRWYVSKLHRHLPRVKFPGHLWDPVNTEKKNSFNIEQFLQHNTHRPVFVCIGLSEGDPSWERTFSRWPWGVCEQLVPVTVHLHPEVWAHRTQHLYNWSQPHDSFPPGSWERVANEEMWQARMKIAFFLFDLAERMEGEAQTRLYDLSYNFYCQIVDAQADYPSNWDKNLALAAERLLRSGGGSREPDSLLSRSIRHFGRYLQREPMDPQRQAIRSAMTHLRKERERLRDSQRQKH